MQEIVPHKFIFLIYKKPWFMSCTFSSSFFVTHKDMHGLKIFTCNLSFQATFQADTDFAR